MTIMYTMGALLRHLVHTIQMSWMISFLLMKTVFLLFVQHLRRPVPPDYPVCPVCPVIQSTPDYPGYLVFPAIPGILDYLGCLVFLVLQ
ncbi:MAG: hypothetical protein EBY28_22020 [Betaproteobacteria bacterium]|nr:hypothetical protein [Betaproteobacteria bacterium]